MSALRLALCQINTVVGDLAANRAMILSSYAAASAAKADVALFPEMTITGYPPEDLLLKPRFVEDNLVVLSEIAARVETTAAVIGFADGGDAVYNAAAVCVNGEHLGTYHKRHLPSAHAGRTRAHPCRDRRMNHASASTDQIGDEGHGSDATVSARAASAARR